MAGTAVRYMELLCLLLYNFYSCDKMEKSSKIN